MSCIDVKACCLEWFHYHLLWNFSLGSDPTQHLKKKPNLFKVAAFTESDLHLSSFENVNKLKKSVQSSYETDLERSLLKAGTSLDKTKLCADWRVLCIPTSLDFSHTMQHCHCCDKCFTSHCWRHNQINIAKEAMSVPNNVKENVLQIQPVFFENEWVHCFWREIRKAAKLSSTNSELSYVSTVFQYKILFVHFFFYIYFLLVMLLFNSVDLYLCSYNYIILLL